MTGALYFTSGAIAGILGVALLAWALFGDRSQGRKRCPKCWYDMSAATGLRCPECGREARSERTLHKTRRRWRWVLASLLPFALAAFLAVQPKVQRDGWWSIMPTTVMLAYFSIAQDDAVIEAIDRRMTVEYGHAYFEGTIRAPGVDTLYRWQWRWLGHIVLRRLGDDASLTADQRNMYMYWASTIRDFLPDDPTRTPLAESIALLLKHEDAEVRRWATLYVVDAMRPEWTVERLRPLIEDAEWHVRDGAILGLRLLVDRSHSDTAIAVLIGALEHEDHDVRFASASALGSVGRNPDRNFPEIKPALRAALNRTAAEDGWHREYLARTYLGVVEADELHQLLREWLDGDDPHVRSAALEHISHTHHKDRRPYLGDALRELARDDARERDRFSASLILRHWNAPESLRPHEAELRRLAQHSDGDTAYAAMTALASIGIHLDLPAHQDDAETWGHDESP